MEHEEEAHALEDARRPPLGLAPRVPVGHVAQAVDDLGFEAGLLAHLAKRRFLHALAFLDVPLGQDPHEVAAGMDAAAREAHRPFAADATADEPPGGELAHHRRSSRRRFHASRFVAVEPPGTPPTLRIREERGLREPHRHVACGPAPRPPRSRPPGLSTRAAIRRRLRPRPPIDRWSGSARRGCRRRRAAPRPACGRCGRPRPRCPP